MRGNSLVRGFVYRGSTVTTINKAVARVPVPESLLFTRVPVAHVQSVLGAWRTQWIVMSSIAS